MEFSDEEEKEEYIQDYIIHGDNELLFECKPDKKKADSSLLKKVQIWYCP